ncbi:Ninjurin-1 [Sarcoptes scabiei]|nr:Ninjurin-1 [Sarcoptes scabiei]
MKTISTTKQGQGMPKPVFRLFRVMGSRLDVPTVQLSLIEIGEYDDLFSDTNLWLPLLTSPSALFSL